jgi:uncharacterized protein (DUF488 family)
MLYSVGHSTHSKEDFTVLLKSANIDILVDVRSHPGSRWPQFQKEELEVWVPNAGFEYMWMPELGGWSERYLRYSEEMAKHGISIGAYAKSKFPKDRIAQKTLPGEHDSRQEFLPTIKPFWSNRGLLEYSFFTSIPEFFDGTQKLIELSENMNVAYFCSEVLWWCCHRSMLSDYLFFKGTGSYHIMPHIRQKNKIKYIDGNKLISHSDVIGNRLERYKLSITDAWKANAK